MSIWNPDNVKDVAESVGINALSDEVLQALSSDVEFRLSQILEEAIKYMRHAKRTTMTTQDITLALRTLDVEPLYGYESTRPLRFGEASIGPGQPLFYVEDEEVDFEKLINAPLPKVPREMSMTAHWLAVDGVQPIIPQNPTPADTRSMDLLPKGSSANPHLSAVTDTPTATTATPSVVKPQVKHVLSQELQLYFGKVTSALLDESNEEYRVAALASLRTDPGLHQLVPYFVQFVAEKVTHGLKDVWVLTQVMHLAEAMLENRTLHLDPYISSLIPPILTTLLSPHIGPAATPPSTEHYPLRQLSASLLTSICAHHAKSSQALKPRLARTCLKSFLSPSQPLRVHYGAILGLQATGGKEVIRALVLPAAKEYGEGVLKEAAESGDEGRKGEAELVARVLVGVMASLEDDEDVDMVGVVRQGANGTDEAEWRAKVDARLGGYLGERVMKIGGVKLAKTLVRAVDIEDDGLLGFKGGKM
ncbi:hypothetical protein MMC25_006875 [Agyrium rufum]|nr:hypothetical protein [Agyrium rufum]